MLVGIEDVATRLPWKRQIKWFCRSNMAHRSKVACPPAAIDVASTKHMIDDVSYS